MINLENSNFKSTEELKSIAPSIFTTTPSKGVSEKYTHIPTSKIIEDMELLGWNVVDAKEVKSRKNIGFQKHLVVFRNNDVVSLQIRTIQNGDRFDFNRSYNVNVKIGKRDAAWLIRTRELDDDPIPFNFDDSLNNEVSVGRTSVSPPFYFRLCSLQTKFSDSTCFQNKAKNCTQQH